MINSDKDELLLAKIELGKNYTTSIDIEFINDSNDSEKVYFKFKVHNQTIKEDLEILIKEEQILGSTVNDEYILLASKMLATLDTVIDEIYFKDKNGNLIKFNNSFLFLVENTKQIGKFYIDVIIPVYNEYIQFRDSISKTSLDELKKILNTDWEKLKYFSWIKYGLPWKIEDMTHMQLMSILARESISQQTPEKQQDSKQEESWQKKLEEAQQRSLYRQKTKEEKIKEAQERIANMITNKKENK